jgi:hypothetical protein
MTPELLTSILGVILSLLASYFPGFSGWYAALETVTKRLVMAVGLLLIAVAIAGITCLGYGNMIGVSLTCDVAGGWIVIKAFLAAIAVNQATYQLTKPSMPEPKRDRKPAAAKV